MWCGAATGGAAFAQNLLPTPNELRAAGLETAWWAVAAVPAGRGKVTHLSADEDAVYVQTNTNLLTAIDLTTGARKWVTRLGRAGQSSVLISTTPAVDVEGGREEGGAVGSAPGLVVTCVGRVAYGLNKDTGETLWELPLPEAASAALTVGRTEEGRRLFAPGVTGSVYSFDLSRIEEFYLEKRLPEFATGTQMWRYETGARLSGPVFLEGIVAVFANDKGVLFGVEAEKRKLLWRFETGGRSTAPIVAADGVAYVASSDRNLYAVNIENGLDRWEFVSQEPIAVQPAIVRGALYVTPGQGGVARVDRDTGRAIWWADRATGFLAQAGERAYVSDGPGNVVALNLADGRPIGTVRLNRYPVRMQNSQTDRIIVANEAGVVLCLKAAGAGFPTYFANPDRRPVEPAFAGDEPAGDEPAGDEPATRRRGLVFQNPSVSRSRVVRFGRRPSLVRFRCLAPCCPSRTKPVCPRSPPALWKSVMN